MHALLHDNVSTRFRCITPSSRINQVAPPLCLLFFTLFLPVFYPIKLLWGTQAPTHPSLRLGFENRRTLDQSPFFWTGRADQLRLSIIRCKKIARIQGQLATRDHFPFRGPRNTSLRSLQHTPLLRMCCTVRLQLKFKHLNSCLRFQLRSPPPQADQFERVFSRWEYLFYY